MILLKKAGPRRLRGAKRVAYIRDVMGDRILAAYLEGRGERLRIEQAREWWAITVVER